MKNPVHSRPRHAPCACPASLVLGVSCCMATGAAPSQAAGCNLSSHSLPPRRPHAGCMSCCMRTGKHVIPQVAVFTAVSPFTLLLRQHASLWIMTPQGYPAARSQHNPESTCAAQEKHQLFGLTCSMASSQHCCMLLKSSACLEGQPPSARQLLHQPQALDMPDGAHASSQSGYLLLSSPALPVSP